MKENASNLLIVDDNKGICALLNELFSEEGYVVETASSGEEGLRKVRAKRPALILLDIKMPGMNGIEALEEIGKLAPGVPVVLMTAYTELDTVLKEKKKTPQQYYIAKPFALEDISHLVKKILCG
ncbi:response regulator [Pelotomaculum terephthalicicum JT]|uniref:response regulator n=1 Tax=Pelotomaculum TaxID=191373 RepID=UPI0009C56D8D|nr:MULTISPECIES: response regulator [Pelotomaculum]MCG9968347.1 response regulator [Pelotomaculum terephthalicicum JT]OPX87544.1 MAG: Sporulation initiation phosphotransferase F [Pelotomaculum sp. PtaB.Bin117]